MDWARFWAIFSQAPLVTLVKVDVELRLEVRGRLRQDSYSFQTMESFVHAEGSLS
jgi:hypothetical protein